jgi:polo-like kinase 1
MEERLEFDSKVYLKGRFLGKGGFAKCYEITEQDTQRVLAAKIVAKNSLVKASAREKLES